MFIIICFRTKVFVPTNGATNLSTFRAMRIMPATFRQESKKIMTKSAETEQPFICLFYIFSSLGSVPELPAKSCTEIRASERENAVSGNYWFDYSLQPGEVVLDRCDMFNQGKQTSGIIWFSASASSNNHTHPPHPLQVASIISGERREAIGFPARGRLWKSIFKEKILCEYHIIYLSGA